jgi:uncharacterized OB-fold protein
MEPLPFTFASFQQYLDQGRLMGVRCLACGQIDLPPRPICRRCHASQMEWAEMPSEGRLAAFTCISIGPTRLIAEGFDRTNPYCAGVVALENGARISARILGVDARDPASIRVGAPLTVEFLHRGEDKRTVLAFRPAGSVPLQPQQPDAQDNQTRR